jgi:hypothetical protein
MGASMVRRLLKNGQECVVFDRSPNVVNDLVEDDHMNILCMGGRTVGPSVALDLVQTFLAAEFSQAPRHLRRLGQNSFAGGIKRIGKTDGEKL